MNVPIVNRTGKEILLGLEPEGDTFLLGPGKGVIIRTVGDAASVLEVGFDIEDGLVTVSVMCEKQLWEGDERLR